MQRHTLPPLLRQAVRQPAAPLLGLLLLAGTLVYAFVQLTDEVQEGDTHAWDNKVLLLFRTPGNPEDPLGPLWLEIFMRDITALGSFAILWTVVIASMAYLIVRRRVALGLLMGLWVGAAALLNTALKIGFDRPRPDIVASVAEVYTASYPSGHAMLSAVVFLTLGAFLAALERRWRLRTFWAVLAVFITLLVGFSRMYLGVHYPSDVLAGWSLGAAWALAGLALAHALRADRRRSSTSTAGKI